MDNAEQNPVHRERSPHPCWFCEQPPGKLCECGRTYCDDHGYEDHCLLCALGKGLFEGRMELDPLSRMLMLSLSVAAGDPYIVIQPALQRTRALTLAGVERTVGAMLKMMASNDDDLRRRAGGVLAAASNSWGNINPSPLTEHVHGTSLLAADQVRRWLTYTLRLSRSLKHEAIALAMLEKLRTADFRDMYPAIEENLTALSCSSVGTRVRDVFEALIDFYPTHSDLVNEQAEIMVYEHYANPSRGAADALQRQYGPLLRYSPTLNKMLKKGTWLASQARYHEWFFGEGEPY
jgi:hypothetical protein